MMYQLCYVDGHIMWFTDNFADQWGDDWDDKPYEHNADPPYEYSEELPDEFNKHRGRFVMACWFDPDYEVGLPCDKFLNSPYSVEDINAGAVAWLFKRGAGGLMGGATVEDARAWCQKAGVLFAVFEKEEKPKGRKKVKAK